MISPLQSQQHYLEHEAYHVAVQLLQIGLQFFAMGDRVDVVLHGRNGVVPENQKGLIVELPVQGRRREDFWREEFWQHHQVTLHLKTVCAIRVHQGLSIGSLLVSAAYHRSHSALVLHHKDVLWPGPLLDQHHAVYVSEHEPPFDQHLGFGRHLPGALELAGVFQNVVNKLRPVDVVPVPYVECGLLSPAC